ncbi:hypothetical protein JCGZ_05644 [Jatropha curcas]|uniref:HMA domain-containing protein n=1 Tax=Jatropha curcas TaxID=180498 RepID=A0A067L6Y0_JATCU|nr:protein SODIUM POTASSIUM ROOT DEFECTIVE 2 isoform X2 [Jatropha curcas]KDP44177.1 hypothetical protein JCGZ_05644 [Jatropha curcas]
MKRIDFFCASPASTAICSSQDHRSMIRHGTRHIDRKNSKTYSHYDEKNKKVRAKQSDLGRKSSADNKLSDLRRRSCSDINDVHVHSPKGSSRYLLSEKVPSIDWISAESDLSSTLDIDPKQNLRLSSSRSAQSTKSRHYPSSDISNSPALKPSSSARSHDQVVVLWVSIHCKGCEGKVRKHISKMEGVTSFSIDLATKKVTVIGNVTPLGVLASVSKVKNAQLWPCPSSSSPSSIFLSH